MSFECLKEDRIDIYGVLYKCSAGIREENCSLKDFDILSFNERVERIDSLIKEDIEKIIEHHRSCSKLRSYK